jgi:hypothetical protein
VHGIVFQEQVEQRRIQLDTFFNPKRFTSEPAARLRTTLNRHHIQLFHQTFGIGQQRFHLSRDTRFCQFAHNEMVELVVHHAFTIELLNARAIPADVSLRNSSTNRSGFSVLYTVFALPRYNSACFCIFVTPGVMILFKKAILCRRTRLRQPNKKGRIIQPLFYLLNAAWKQRPGHRFATASAYDLSDR